ncbi:MAG: amidase [Cyclobacteriaceae bacterium]|nr:amidase [Cyclobacteriaceae bacterium]
MKRTPFTLKFTLLFTLLIGLIISACQNANSPIDKDMIGHAQQLYDLEFTDIERDSMVDYLNGNLEGYQELHAHSISNDTPLPLIFDPHPKGFQFPAAEQQENLFEIDLSTEVPSDLNEIAFYPITKLAGLLQSGKMTSVQLTTFFLERLKKYGDTLQCVITLTEELALREATQMDEEFKAGKIRGPLHGIPYGIKDLFSTKGYKTTWGAAPYKDQMIDEDARVVELLRDAGAILVAKLTSGMLANGDYWWGGRTLNPWNMNEGARGSSAGPGSATSAGLVPFSIGTETWGSILAPSSRCGISGLRPTYGRVSRAGCMTLSWSMDKAGPMCRNAYDCAIVLSALNGHDNNDRATVDVPFNFRDKSLQNLRIGYLNDIFKNEGDIKNNDSLFIEKLKEQGIALSPIDLPEYLPLKVLSIIIRSESGAAFDELTRENLDDLLTRQTKNSRPNSLRQSHFIPAVEYLQANRIRYKLINAMDSIFKNYDIIIAPGSGSQQSLITNLTGHPAISIPNGFNKEGSPTGITLIGGLYRESDILELAIAFQQITEFDNMYPPQFLK